MYPCTLHSSFLNIHLHFLFCSWNPINNCVFHAFLSYVSKVTSTKYYGTRGCKWFKSRGEIEVGGHTEQVGRNFVSAKLNSGFHLILSVGYWSCVNIASYQLCILIIYMKLKRDVTFITRDSLCKEKDWYIDSVKKYLFSCIVLWCVEYIMKCKEVYVRCMWYSIKRL